MRVFFERGKLNVKKGKATDPSGRDFIIHWEGGIEMDKYFLQIEPEEFSITYSIKMIRTYIIYNI